MKRLFSFILLLCLICALPVAASAQEGLPYVTDVAGLLSETEKAQLENMAADISAQYGCGIYIIAVDDYRKYSNSYDAFGAAEDIYLKYDLGLGSEKNGLLLLLSMADRDFALAAYGNAGHTAFTDYGKEIVIDAFLPDLGNDDWYGGFAAYLDKSASLLQSAAEGNPVDVPEAELGIGSKLMIILGVPAIIALIVCGVFKAQMKTARIQTQATEYVDRSSFNLHAQQDMFLHRSVTRVPIPKSQPSSGGGGTTIRSSGFSGRSGKF